MLKFCCPHPDVDSEGQCQTCFEKIDLKPRGIESWHSINYKMEQQGVRYGGYSEHFYFSMFEREVLFLTAGLESPVDTVGYRKWPAVCAILIMVIAYLVTRFMGQQ